jgi:type II protein arginine methyltransferase
MQSDPISQAFQLFQHGRYELAAQRCQSYLASNPGHAEMNHLFGVIRFHQGRTGEALELMRRAVAAADATPQMHNNYGAALNAGGRTEDAIAAFKKALALDPNYSDALNNLGVIYRDAKNTDAAIAAFKRAVELDPASAQAKINLRSAYRDVVPAWHFAMMDDGVRNAAYDAAIKRAAPGKCVLDIGTGAGLLAMMAARAGAEHVMTCESVAVIAERAREIVARNGFADRITVIAKPSTELMALRDIPERAHVLITETFASNLIGEGMLPTLEHAHEQLLTPDASVIPAAGSVVGYLAGGEVLKGMLFVETIDGFDVSPFNDFGPPVLTARMDEVPHEQMSEDIELLRFDFKEKNFPMEKRRITIPATAPGVCIGIVQWIRLELDSETRYENRPAQGSGFNGHWGHLVHRFARPVPVMPGDVVRIEIRHDRNTVNIDLAE